MDFLDSLKKIMNSGYTENGSKAYLSTKNNLLDLFAKMGAWRYRVEIEVDSKGQIIFNNDEPFKILLKSYLTAPKETLCSLMYLRDIRGGLGERKLFRLFLIYLYLKRDDKQDLLDKTLNSLFDIGRYDDIIFILYQLHLAGIKKEIFYNKIKTQFFKELNGKSSISLLAKWLPSENTSNKQTVLMARFVREKIFEIDSKTYRKALSKLRAEIKLIENNLRERDYSFNYSQIPSLAMAKYNKAFKRNDEDRYSKYLQDVQEGKAKINTQVLTPFDIIRKIQVENNEVEALNTMWNNLPNLFGEDSIDAIVACDVSGSMSGNPICISIGLAIYIAQRNKGRFHNHFIDFCGDSRLHELPNNASIKELYDLVISSSRDMNTNIESVMVNAILETLIKNKIPKEECPKYVIIISDMEFDMCGKGKKTNIEYWKKKYQVRGYDMPTVIFWNVDDRNNIFPATLDEKVILISGYSQNSIKALLKVLNDKMSVENISLQIVSEAIKPYEIYLEKEI